MPTLLKEPLLHFLLIGALLFAVYSWLNPDATGADDSRIEITPGVTQRLEDAWTRQWRRPPDDAEMAGLVEEFIREEVFYREAIALGLDADDTIIRRRLAQKMEFLSEDLGTRAEPTDDELQAFFAERRADFAEAARLSFRHVYFSPDQRGDRTEADARAALAQADPANQGDRFLMQSEYRSLTRRDVAQLFGRVFADAVFELQQDGWQGPIESGFGWHLVQITGQQAERLPAFEEVREQVRLEFDYERQRLAREAVYQQLRDRYEIVVVSGESDS